MDGWDSAFPEAFLAQHPPEATGEWARALEDWSGDTGPVARLLGTWLVLFWQSPETAVLADVFPVLENLGLRIVGHAPYDLTPTGRPAIRAEEFALLAGDADLLTADADLRGLVTDAFAAVWSGLADDDEFNQLVLRAGLSWREVAVLRATFGYLRQAGSAFGTGFARRTLLAHSGVTRLLLGLFAARLDPAYGDGPAESQVLARIEEAMGGVENLSDDRLLRAMRAFVCAIVRTNYYLRDDAGAPLAYLSFKLDPRELDFVPPPRPRVETYVFSPRIEGLHLRNSLVARGGLRWSDRTEDYRTEVLGLVKAQQVKNAVIVAHGAKGAFVLKRPPVGGDRGAVRQELLACYQVFIRGLLDVTDNLVDGTVVPPQGVRCRDDADTYLVVAADKGTADLSDLANSVAADYGFWLGDAFASGGETGYDHKALGVTARGAWESVRRHLGELGLDPARDEFTVVGIGDMSGDVFGNGMLLSDKIRLVAAFDHRHVFLDPAPDPAASFAERSRLFTLPGSSWADYDADLISAGGGVHSRTAKSIELTPEVKAMLDITEDRLPADDLIRAVLKMPADLLFNGGIGTYVKATGETHGDVGDRVNEPVRVDAGELRVRVVAEGGNLGVTQRARVEFGLAGGLVNTDFIDNSAGVDTSDHEVNLKILFDSAVRDGGLTPERRNALIRDVAPQVVEQVLAGNAAQAQSISVSHAQGPGWLDKHLETIEYAVEQGHLDRSLETMPDQEEIDRRLAAGLGLTRAEIATLHAKSKSHTAEYLLASQVPDDPYVGSVALARYLPPALRAEFNDRMLSHPLRREITCCVLANEVINRLGAGVLLRVQRLTGHDHEQMVLGYVAARDVLGLSEIWADIDRLGPARHAALEVALLGETRAVMESAARWFLRQRHKVDPAGEVARLRPGIEKLTGLFDNLLPPPARADLDERVAELVSAGSSVELARSVCLLRPLVRALGVVAVAERTGADLARLTATYEHLGDRLQVDWLRDQAVERAADGHWEIFAKTSLDAELCLQLERIAQAAHANAGPATTPENAATAWLGARVRRLALYARTVDQLRGATAVDAAMLAVALEGLRSL